MSSAAVFRLPNPRLYLTSENLLSHLQYAASTHRTTRLLRSCSGTPVSHRLIWIQGVAVKVPRLHSSYPRRVTPYAPSGLLHQPLSAEALPLTSQSLSSYLSGEALYMADLVSEDRMAQKSSYHPTLLREHCHRFEHAILLDLSRGRPWQDPCVLCQVPRVVG